MRREVGILEEGGGATLWTEMGGFTVEGGGASLWREARLSCENRRGFPDEGGMAFLRRDARIP